MKILLNFQKVDIHFEKKKFFAKELFSKKYRKRVVKPKKGKGSYKQKKI